jgi:hypothetical protein
MPTFRVALLIFCFVAASMQAQTTESQTTVPAESEALHLPQRHDLPQEAPPPERKLTVFPTAASRIASEADTLGDHGNLFLDNATAPSTGIQLLAKTAFPDIFVKLGLSTSGASFNVTDASDVSLFKVRGDGRAIFRKDQNTATIFEINNGTSGNAAYGSLQFFEGTTLKGGLYAFSSGIPGAPGGVNSLMLSNSLSAPLVFGTNGTERMRINGGGNVAINYNGDPPDARLLVQGGTGNAKGVFITHQPLVSSNVTHADMGLAIQSQQNVLPGVTNSGTLLGMYSWTNLIGTGVLANLTGAQIQTGTTVAGTINSMIGVRVQSVLAANSTIGTGYAVYLDDVQATNDYGFFQAASNDTNFFAGNVMIGGSPSAATSSHALAVTGSVVASESATIGPAGGNQATSRLTVHGSAHFNGTVTGTNIKAHYQDVAEWVPATTDLAPGTVVILNRGRSNEVMASATAYDTTVAGVVSAQPGISLGVEGEGMEQIATTGRVKVHVDARTSPVRVGDLLVTSGTPGMAMRSEPVEIGGHSFHKPGTIIGKALEPLNDGIGEILVLLSMQ